MSRLIELSKSLSYVLRHRPESVGLTLDTQGWAGVDELLEGMRRKGTPLSREELEEVVRTSDKQRLALSEDGLRVRANQGHTTDSVQLQFTRKTPPTQLYHGTVEKFMASIEKKGLLPMRRHHVHLSATVETATAVGARRGKPVLLVIDAFRMTQDGHAFWLSDNSVWLASAVPAQYLSRLSPGASTPAAPTQRPASPTDRRRQR